MVSPCGPFAISIVSFPCWFTAAWTNMAHTIGDALIGPTCMTPSLPTKTTSSLVSSIGAKVKECKLFLGWTTISSDSLQAGLFTLAHPRNLDLSVRLISRDVPNLHTAALHGDT